jgi:hypothetical protein
MSTPVEHNEPIKPTAPEQIGAAAGAKLGAEYAANMNPPKVESAGPGSADKHLTNMQLIDANGNEVSKGKAVSEATVPSGGDKKEPMTSPAHGDKTASTGAAINPGPTPDKHISDNSHDRLKATIVGAAVGAAVTVEASLVAGLPIGLAVGSAAGLATYEWTQSH